MSTSLLGIGVSGLQAFQRSLDTISHNIANATTDNYSRQTVELVSRPPQRIGNGFTGNGVDVASISRSYDYFAENSVRSSTSAYAEFNAFYTMASQLDNVLADTDVGMSVSLQRFFDAVHDVANSPSDPGSRDVLFNEGQNLADHFNELAGWIESLRGQINSELSTDVNEINGITQSIAQLNEAIVVEQGRSGGRPPNDLLDQRDAQIRNLSDLVSVTTVTQDDGSVNVMIGTGQVLVRSNTSERLAVFAEAGDPNQLGIAIKGGGGVLIPITGQVTGGKLGGVLGFRERMLNPASNSLGLAAIGLANYFNEQHNKGMDLNGALGVDYFSVPQPEALTVTGATGNITVGFDDISQLTNADYRLNFKAGAWELTRADTGQPVPMSGSGTSVDPFIADGLLIEIPVAPVNGDSYLIRPTRKGAAEIDMVLANSNQIATASPLRSLAAIGNTGSGVISAGTVTDIGNAAFQTSAGQLSPPVLVRFTAGNNYDLYDNSNPVAPVLLEAGIPYNPATGGELFPTPGGIDYGYRMQLTGAPSAGDEFSTEYNTGGIGDNRNALALLGVSTEKLLHDGSESVLDAYSALVVDVGSDTKQAELNSLSRKGVLEQAMATRESISGVNLDEEAANLIKYQQAYQAAAQVIATANSLFDTLMTMLRR
jgi:flagellar hook-associated protein 1